MNEETTAKRIVQVILEELGDRSGWDGFWGGIDEETRKEISETLKEWTLSLLQSSTKEKSC